MPSDPEFSSVFHYTDMASLLGVVSRGELWASEASGMNDTAELEGGLNRIRRWLEGRRADPVVDDVLTHVFPSKGDQLAAVFVLSASLEHDDASQWRLYGADGEGCCIELDTTPQLSVRTTVDLAHERDLNRKTGLPKKSAPAGANPRFVRGWLNAAGVTPWTATAYDDADVEVALTAMIANATRDFAAAEASATYHDDVWADSLQRVLDEITRLANTFKGEAWKHEREARVVATLVPSSPHSNFRTSKYGLIQYVRLAEHTAGTRHAIARKGEWRVPIKSVTLGPRQNFRLAAPSVKVLLDRHGYRAALEDDPDATIPGRIIIRSARATMR